MSNRCRYGTPFLLSLGVSEQVTSLVWLAGPISGLVAQPVIGLSPSLENIFKRSDFIAQGQSLIHRLRNTAEGIGSSSQRLFS
jgi:hypothetical protein